MTKASIEQHRDFEYNLGSQAREVGSYKVTEIKLEELLKMYKTSKKHISFGCPLADYKDINNNIYLILMKMQPNCCFVIREDMNFVVGYHELKYLYRWMYKGVALNYDGREYYFEDMSKNYKQRIKELYVRVKVFSDSTNINSFIRRHFNNDVRFIN